MNYRRSIEPLDLQKIMYVRDLRKEITKTMPISRLDNLMQNKHKDAKAKTISTVVVTK